MLKNLFTPNASISRSVMSGVMLVQAAVFLGAWQLNGFSILPTPIEILEELGRLWGNDDLGYHFVATLKWNFAALLISTVVALLLSYSTVLPFMRPIVNAISKIRFMGIAGWIFFFVVISPNVTTTKLLLFMFGYCGYIISSVVSVVNGALKEELDYARTLKMNEWQVAWASVVKGKFDKVIDVVRDTAAMGLLILVMIEAFFRSQGGLGVMLQNQSKVLNLKAIFALQFVVFMVGIFQDWAILQFKKVACPYVFLKLERR